MRRSAPILTTALVWIAACQHPAPKPADAPPAANAREIGVGDRAPSFRAPDIEGQATSLESGKVYVIGFLATWSSPDKRSVPELEAIYQRHRAEGLTVLAIDIDEDEAKNEIPRFYRESGGTFRVVHDLGHRISKQFGVPCSPTYYVVDRKGVVRYRHCGYTDEASGAIEREAVRVLSPSGS